MTYKEFIEEMEKLTKASKGKLKKMFKPSYIKGDQTDLLSVALDYWEDNN